MARTYAEAGVDIDASDHATAALVAQLGSATRKGDGAPITLENGFAGLVQLATGGLRSAPAGAAPSCLSARVSYTHPRPHQTQAALPWRLLLEKKNILSLQ